MAPAKPLIIYIHGFNSSPASHKAQTFQNYVQAHDLPCELWIPELPVWPGEAARMLLQRALEAGICRPVHIIGSSLGGYYGTWLMESILDHCPDCPVKLVLINPAVRPYDLFEDYLGPQKNYYSDVEYELTQEHVDQLRHLEIETLSRPDNILLLVQTGDETLDYQQAVARYAECPARIDEGGSHAYDGFETTIPVILQFLSAHYVAAVSLSG
ncbi:esterase YqiA [Kistimonas scapharcae]|uniref:Esterase YqiA n=1 Tax=Kistimonas scapharcae TaxID=1036133 RepID=A0ABP8V4C8_9GAMM